MQLQQKNCFARPPDARSSNTLQQCALAINPLSMCIGRAPDSRSSNTTQQNTLTINPQAFALEGLHIQETQKQRSKTS